MISNQYINHLITEEGQLWIRVKPNNYDLGLYGTIYNQESPAVEGYSKAIPQVPPLRQIMWDGKIGKAILLTEEGRVGHWNNNTSEVDYLEMDIPEVISIYFSSYHMSILMILVDGRLITVEENELQVIQENVKWIVEGDYTDILIGDDYIQSSAVKLNLGENIINANQSAILTESGKVILYPFIDDYCGAGNNLVHKLYYTIHEQAHQDLDIVDIQRRYSTNQCPISGAFMNVYPLIDSNGNLLVLKYSQYRNGSPSITPISSSLKFKRFLSLGYEAYQFIEDENNNVYLYEIEDDQVKLKIVPIPGILIDLDKKCFLPRSS